MESPFPLSQFRDLVPSNLAFEFIQRVFRGSPGIFATTGQSGTGKLTLLLAIVQEFAKSGSSVALLTEQRNFPFELPSNWSIYLIESTEKAWMEATKQSLNSSFDILIVDMLSLKNYKTIFYAARQKQWVFTCIETPYIGIDVAYNFRDWQGLSYLEILQYFSGIWSQVLLPRLCRNCAKSMQISAEEMRLLDPSTNQSEKLWQELGCQICEQRGTKGRCAAYEILQIDDETRPILRAYLEKNSIHSLPNDKHWTIQECGRSLLRDGSVGIETYKQVIFQNPMLRIQHLLEQEKYHSSQLRDMFSRFVNRQVVERIMNRWDFAKIVEGERRKATCMFCDVRNFTSYAENASPDEIFVLLNNYFRDIIEIAFNYEGTIDKFIGDSIMLVFGAPTDQEDQELRAVLCAIEIQKKVSEINQCRGNTLPIQLQLGIGINTGNVVAGCLGSERRMDYTVLGDVINTAARIESRAAANQILISSETFLAVQEHIPCRSIGVLVLKGKVETVEAFEVVYS